MSTNPTVYTYKRCFNSKLIQIMSKFSNKQLDIVYIDGMSETNIKRLVGKSPTEKFPLYQDGEFFLSGTIAIARYVLANNEELSTLLLGKDQKRISANQMWIDYTTYNIWPFYYEIIGQITGIAEAHEGLFSTAIGDLMQVLISLNKHLTFKTFLIDHQVSLADIVLAQALYPYFTLVLEERLRENIPHVARWFNFVANIKEVRNVIGKPRLCQVTQKPFDGARPISNTSSNISTNQDKKVEEKKPQDKKPQEKKPQEKKPQEKKPQEKKPEPVSTPTTTVESELSKPKNPLDVLPPSNFDLDAFKREFLNTKEKAAVLEKFWTIYDNQGYSIWFLHYNRSGEQGKIKFRTCNLKSNFLQNLEKFRRYTFAVHGVYGTEPNLEVEGVWMWRGTDIPEEV